MTAMRNQTIGRFKKDYLFYKDIFDFQNELWKILNEQIATTVPNKSVVSVLLLDAGELLIGARVACEICAYTSSMTLVRAAYDRLELARYLDKHPDKIAHYANIDNRAPSIGDIMTDLFGINTPERRIENTNYATLCNFSHANSFGQQIHVKIIGGKTRFVLLGYNRKAAKHIIRNVIKFTARLICYEIEIIDSNKLKVKRSTSDEWERLRKKLKKHRFAY